MGFYSVGWVVAHDLVCVQQVLFCEDNLDMATLSLLVLVTHRCQKAVGAAEGSQGWREARRRKYIKIRQVENEKKPPK